MQINKHNNSPNFGATIKIKDPKKILQGAIKGSEIYVADKEDVTFTERELEYIQNRFATRTRSMKGHLEVDVDYQKALSTYGEDQEQTTIKYFREEADGSKVYEASLPIKILYGFSLKGAKVENGRSIIDVTGLSDAEKRLLTVDGFVDALIKSFKTLKFISQKEKQTARLMKQKEILDQSIESKLNWNNIGFALDSDWLHTHKRMKQIQKNIYKDVGKEVRIETNGYIC